MELSIASFIKCINRLFKAGFHYRRSRSRSRSRRRSRKSDGIGVRRIRTFPFLPTPLTTPPLTFRL